MNKGQEECGGLTLAIDSMGRDSLTLFRVITALSFPLFSIHIITLYQYYPHMQALQRGYANTASCQNSTGLLSAAHDEFTCTLMTNSRAHTHQ